MKTLKFTLLALGLLIGGSTYSQDYKTGIGVRFGWDYGITVKHFISGQDALEGVFSSRWRGFQFTGLYERHTPAFRTEGLKAYFGGGGHVGTYYGRYYRPYYFRPEDRYYNDYFVNIGVDGVLGLEYTIPSAPLSFSLDLRPGIDLVYLTPVYIGGGFSIRYAIK